MYCACILWGQESGENMASPALPIQSLPWYSGLDKDVVVMGVVL